MACGAQQDGAVEDMSYRRLQPGCKVVWISKNGPEVGLARWIGVLSDKTNHGEFVAVDFENPLETPNEKFGPIPARDLITYEEFCRNDKKVPERRILMIGKTGHGKSSTGNTLLGKDSFEVSHFSSSLTSKSTYEEAYRFSKKLVIVDTPGFFDTRDVDDEIITELIRICAFLSPGFHAVFLVLIPEKYTQENQKTVEKYIQFFGNEMFKYTFLIFTHWDEKQKVVGSLEEFCEHGSKELKELLSKCGNRIFAFDNTTKNDCQVDKIVEAMEENLKTLKGKFLTNQVFKGTEVMLNYYFNNPRLLMQPREEQQLMLSLSKGNTDTQAMLPLSVRKLDEANQVRLYDSSSGEGRRKILPWSVFESDEDSPQYELSYERSQRRSLLRKETKDKGIFNRIADFIRNLLKYLGIL